ncbi:MAG TPA: type I polyketide synthase, partial [Amycolatopsis sp.]|uniref:type I polyketide synthase n=1 Tax=Amycolatopsis sp. TaxID=37632 RepID=UPI002B4651C4
MTTAHEDAPVAVVGMSCRLPGAPDPDSFWQLLRTGTAAITEAPAARWTGNGVFDDALPPAHGRLGGFLDDVDRFDAEFFGISPREAAVMDPQQRLVLELGWEALEDARIVPEALRGTPTGVFVASMWDDYAILVRRGGPEVVSQHTMTGLHRSVIANRLSFKLGLRGPSLGVDAGQCSSLLAVHLACESLRRGECSAALVGGVNLMLVAENTVTVDRLGALSPDGRCFTFDARANGFVRGEGGAVMVLKPLAAALVDGDPIYCVIRGSAVNNDGGGDSLVTPEPAAQADVIRAAYRRAGVDPAEVQYVEMHGAGTKVGDPIEAAALGAALGAGRSVRSPLRVGSVKTNIGHLDGAAGMAGLVKTILCLTHREFVPSLNFETPSPLIPLRELNLAVQSVREPWSAGKSGRAAGVSAFSMGGTNCHVVLAEPPRPTEPARSPRRGLPRRPVPWLLSGATPQGLRAQARKLRAYVARHRELEPGDIAHSLATSRSAFRHRAALVAEDQADFLRGLAALADGAEFPGLACGRAGDPGAVAFLFTGQGAQRCGMGRELYAGLPVFADAFDEVCAQLDDHLDRRLKDVVFAPEGVPDAELLHRTDYTQVALFAIETALYRVARRWGLRPDFVLGHSVGEIAAAHAAGILDLADACTLVATRGRLMRTLPARGAMVALQATEDEVQLLLAGYEDRASIAVVNGPTATVISGEEPAVLAVAAQVEAWGRKATRLRISIASHSPLMDDMLDEFREVAEGLTYASPRLPLVSTVTGERAAEELCTPEYWVRNVRRAVRFCDGVRSLQSLGVRTFLELGPSGVLSALTRDCLIGSAEDIADTTVSASLAKDEPELATLLTATAGLYTRGVPVDWEQVFAGNDYRTVPLPTYAFVRKRYWVDVSAPEAPHATAPVVSRPVIVAEPEEDADALRRSGLATRLAGRPAAECDQVLADVVSQHVAVLLGHSSAEAIDVDVAFRELGLDSMTGVRLCQRLADATGVRVPATALFEHPTPRELARRLAADLSQAATTSTSSTLVATTDEPIAIVGMACRYPGGVRSPEQLWQLLVSGDDAISGFPTDRGWDLERLYAPGEPEPRRTYVREGGFLADATLFDPDFFGISPREAVAMDPQQRLLLETAWEAFEHAGIAPDSVRGSQTGVFVGAMSQDYGPRLHEAERGLHGHVLTGTTLSVASGRLAYAFGLRGPALTIDTACSSSLVALHLAAQALRRGECTLALAGGVAVMSSPGMFVEFSQQRGLAPDGRCKPFSDAANGTVWSEGVGLLVLQPLAEARRKGNPVLAVVRGSAVNSDGASNGLTAPNGAAQERVILEALADARLTPEDVDVVEAHGTGTVLGDPIEAQAVLATYGRNRGQEEPALLGSMKANIGHAQAAAGVAGVIKLVMALRYGLLPATPNIGLPSSHVDWASGAVALLDERRPWPQGKRTRRGAVSSFGISGTNAHAIIEQAPTEAPAGEAPDDAPAQAVGAPWVLSAATAPALREQAQRLRSHLVDQPDLQAADVAWSLATTRTTLEHRAAVAGRDRAELVAGLDKLVRGEPSPVVPQGVASKGKLAVLFPGQGGLRPGAGRGLYETSARFARALDEVTAAFDGKLDRPLREVMFAEPGTAEAELLDQVAYAQPALFALEVALFRLIESWGVRPDFLAGHSAGELAAAHVAGVLSLADAAILVAARGRLMQALPGTGAMVSVAAGAAEVAASLAGHEAEVGIAALNGPAATVVSGEESVVLAVAARAEAQGRKTTRLRTGTAYHSPLMDAMLPEFRQVAAALHFAEPRIPIISGLTGAQATAEQLTDPGYWVRHVREAVQFHDSVRCLEAAGVRRFCEVGPDGALAALTHDCLTEDVARAAVRISVLRKDKHDDLAATGALAELFVAGSSLNWTEIFAGSGARRVDLPTYAFQRGHYWLAPPSATRQDGTGGLLSAAHPLLGAELPLAESGGLVLTGTISQRAHPWLADHAIAGSAVLAGTACAELALHAGRRLDAGRLRELTLHSPLVLPEESRIQLQVTVSGPDEFGHRSVRLHSRVDDASGGEGVDELEWALHAEGTLAADETAPPGQAGAWPVDDVQEIRVDDLYDRLARAGYDYGPTFQAVRSAWRHGDELLAELALPDPGQDGAGAVQGFAPHPVLLDAALHLVVAERLDDTGTDTVLVPFSFSGLTTYMPGTPAIAAVRARITPREADSVSVVVTDDTGAPVASIDRVVFRPIQPRQFHAGGRDTVFRVTWAETGVTATTAVSRWAVLGEVHAALRATLDGTGVPVASYADLAALRAAVQAGAALPDVVIAPVGHAAGAAADGPSAPDSVCAADVCAADVHLAVGSAVELVRSWLADDALSASRLVVLTRHAVGADQAPIRDLASASVWGLLRSAQSEHPGRIVLADCDDASPYPALLTALGTDVPQMAVRGSRVLLPELRPAELVGARPSPFEGSGTVLLTGAFGALGRLLARHLVVRHGVRHLLLTSRRGAAADGARDLVAQLTALGAVVRVAACDLGDRGQLAALLDSVAAEAPLRAVVHAAGILDDGTIGSLTDNQIERVLRPKVDGTLNLHELTRDRDLSAFVLFSSVAGVIGTAGQANYAAANTFLDALAAHRMASGLPGTSLAWGIWEAADGLAGGLSTVDVRRMSHAGVGVLPGDAGLALFDEALSRDEAVLVPLRTDVAALRQAAVADVPSLMRTLVPARTGRRSRAVEAWPPSLRTRLAGLAPAERERALRDLVRAETAAVLGHAQPATVPDEQAFRDLGFDSLTSVELRNRLGAVLELRMPATLLFDYPTPEEVVAYLLTRLAPAPQVASAVSTTTVADPAGEDDPVVIVAMACRYPGGVACPEDLWELVATGSDAISTFPANRGWNIEALYDPRGRSGTSYTREGGFLHDVDLFDPELFDISPREAAAMDPQQRLLLETSWETFERAGLSPTGLRGSDVGVFVGLMYHDYGHTAVSPAQDVQGYLLTGTTGSVLSGRVAYTFGLQGPALTVDTACSSSLVALHLAVRALRNGECSLALA